MIIPNGCVSTKLVFVFVHYDGAAIVPIGAMNQLKLLS